MDFDKMSTSALNGRKKVTPILRDGHSADIDGPNASFYFDEEVGFEAANPYDVSFQLSLDVGAADSIGMDIFQCIIATNNYRDKYKDKKDILYFEKYTFLALKLRLNNILKDCEGENWNDCLLILRKVFSWEYEGMYDEDHIKALNSK